MATYTVAAEGNGLTYQWQVGRSNVWTDSSSAGSNSASFSLSISASHAKYQYRCLITDADGNIIVTTAVNMTVS